jgi:cyclopropane fatty-acyl-phospholipid synthase-like methyltransferase
MPHGVANSICTSAIYRAGGNPLHREAMLEQMNAEVLARLELDGIAEPQVVDLGCGLGATLRSFARRLPNAKLLGITRVPWQVEHACALNEAAGCGERVALSRATMKTPFFCHPPATTVCTRWRVVATHTARTRACC